MNIKMQQRSWWDNDLLLRFNELSNDIQQSRSAEQTKKSFWDSTSSFGKMSCILHRQKLKRQSISNFFYFQIILLRIYCHVILSTQVNINLTAVNVLAMKWHALTIERKDQCVSLVEYAKQSCLLWPTSKQAAAAGLGPLPNVTKHYVLASHSRAVTLARNRDPQPHAGRTQFWWHRSRCWV